jgi:hypothetical protein
VGDREEMRASMLRGFVTLLRRRCGCVTFFPKNVSESNMFFRDGAQERYATSYKYQ